VREKLVREIARQLHLQIDQLESSRSLHDRPNNPDAMDNFRIARARLDIDDSPEAFRAAQALLEKAIAQQPKFGDALAELGWVLLRKNQSFDDQAEGDRDWVEAADVIGRVLELAPQNSLARTVRARQLFMENNIHDAAMAAKIAVQIEPSNVDAHWVLADCAWGLGQLDQEEAELAMVGELNPDGLLNKQRLLMLGAIELLKNHPKDAIELLTQSISGDPEPVPGDGQGGRAQYARLLLIAAYSLAEQPQEAKERYRTYNQKWPNRSVWRFEATLPRAIDAMPNAQAMLSALQSAGMPRYADGSDSVMPPGVDCAGDDYSKTPLGLPNGRVLETADVDRALAASIKPLVVDVSLFGSGALQDALWYDPAGPAETSTEFVERVVSNLRASDQTRPVIVMGDGPFGCAAYNAAVNLIEKKYQNVQWYRGGEEAWVASGHKFQDHRPE
jgi:tetratricopeptide (TPR) repeat protein